MNELPVTVNMHIYMHLHIRHIHNTHRYTVIMHLEDSFTFVFAVVESLKKTCCHHVTNIASFMSSIQLEDWGMKLTADIIVLISRNE
jgi:hypothetical protein